MDRGCQVIAVAGHIFGVYTVTRKERENIVLHVCSTFGNRSRREFCVRVDAGLAVLELNQGFNFILNQLKKSTSLFKQIFSYNCCDMTRLHTDLPVFGTGIVLAEQVSALGIAFQPAETDATIGPVCRMKQTVCHVTSIPSARD